MNNIMEKAKHPCSGCGACMALCPHKAIRLELNSTGFYSAIVDEKQCVGCGLCKKVCLRYAEQLSGIDLKDSDVFALQSADKNTVLCSSSGGVAYELSKSAIEKGWNAVGVEYHYETDRARHTIISYIKDLPRITGSKYLQSDSSVFSQVIEEARQGKRFIIFGVPCQIAGLAKVAEQKKCRDQLLLVEIFCHGVPTYHLWDKECEYLKNKCGCEKFDNIQFRYKKIGWHSYCLKAEGNGRTYTGSREGELFYRAYFEDVLLNDACMDCRMRKTESLADLRIGDYWGKRFASREDGVSAVFANTDSGIICIDELLATGKLVRLPSGTAGEILSCQNMAGYSVKNLHDETMTILQTNGIDAAIKYYRKRLPMKQKIKNRLLSVSAKLPDEMRARLKKLKNS